MSNYRTSILFVRNLREIITPLPQSTGIGIRKAASFHELADLKMDRMIEQKIKNKLRPGKEIFTGILDGRIVNISFIDYTYPIGVMFFGDYTLEEYRGIGINTAVKTAILAYLKEKEIKKVYISCARDNLSSKTSILHAGFTPVPAISRLMLKLLKNFRPSLRFHW